VIEADATLAASRCAGIQRLLAQALAGQPPSSSTSYKLEISVPVATVQLRYDGWVTELGEIGRGKERARRDLGNRQRLETIFFTPLTPMFSCFADSALASPAINRREGRDP